MKIGFSTFVLQGGQSGIGTYIRNLLRSLQEEDTHNRYELLMVDTEADMIPLTNPNFIRILYPAQLGKPLRNIAWHNIGLPQKRYDLLHIPSYRRIPLLKRTRIVATIHDMAAFSVEKKYDRARMFFNRKIAPSMIRKADHVIAVSHATRDDIIRLTGYPAKRISVIYSGIDHTLFRPVARDEARRQLKKLHGLEKPFFVYTSRLEHPGKNHVRLIQAFERFKLENDSAHQLVFAGADWLGAKVIHARAAESPVREDIIFTGFVPVYSLSLLYSGCDLMIYPSLYEGFGFPIIEALACGAPVICSGTSSMNEIAGTLLPTFDPSRADAVFHALENAVSRGWSAEDRARGMDYARTFDWTNTARRCMEVYESLV